MTTKEMPEVRAVLFVLIGWAEQYNENENIKGDHKFLQTNPAENSEAEAFLRQRDGYYYCGVGRGNINEENVDVVFVARDENLIYRIVALYQDVSVDYDGNWAIVKSEHVVLYKTNERPPCIWVQGHGMRRWARRINGKGRVHEDLWGIYRKIVNKLDRAGRSQNSIDPELSAFEGELRKRFLRHRFREACLRKAKIRQVLREKNGKLECEVPKCGFDFSKIYGEIGSEYAVVHHLLPLGKAPTKGIKTSIRDLAVVCANCHAMIHRGGECRPLESLIGHRLKSSPEAGTKGLQAPTGRFLATRPKPPIHGS